MERTEQEPHVALALIMRDFSDSAPETWDALVEKLQAFLLAYPNYGRGQYYLGVVLSLQGKDAEAEAAFRAVLQQGPTAEFGAEVAYNLGVVLRAQGKAEDARHAFNLALELTEDQELGTYIMRELALTGPATT